MAKAKTGQAAADEALAVVSRTSRRARSWSMRPARAARETVGLAAIGAADVTSGPTSWTGPRTSRT